MHSRRLGGIVVALALLAGCSSGSQAEPVPTEAGSPAESGIEDRAEDLRGVTEVWISGAAEAHWQGETRFRVVRVGAAGAQVNLVSVGMPVPEVVPERPEYRLRWAFDLSIPDYAGEPGEFTLPAHTDGTRSTPVVVWLHVTEAAKSKPIVEDEAEVVELRYFTNARQPCTVRVEQPRERAGTLECPEIADDSGRTISLRATWRIEEP